MDWTFEAVAGPFEFTEGPIWKDGGLLFTDIPASRIMRYDPSTRTCDEYHTGTNGANGLALDNEGRVCAAEGTFLPTASEFVDGPGRRIARYEHDGSTTTIAETFEGKRFNSPNDLTVDAAGRVWFTDPRYGSDRSCMELDHESVFRADPQPDGSYTVSRVTFDTDRPNGLIVTPDMKTLYVAQSHSDRASIRELRAYPINEDGSTGEYEVLHNFGPHRGIDGMTLDEDLNIVGSAGFPQSGPGPMIYVFTPKGRVLETHPFPINPTNCIFGGEDLTTLYVTASDGKLYEAKTNRKGLA
ncbi:MAG: SMP-30/gluconolactonase/LRE family protein [Candidatus Latescibacteria bacterium]|jgi:gluconolactonase|nr:SMP-30/gluconolactonase/LRE family protein [Candidatus Latescibacterota bacterium]MBT4140141.1 SMP-30/gluconolactonase/LRE family protein [Candidatus Latescibacterota bacterium]